MCHKGQPFRPYGLHVWGPTLEVCNNELWKSNKSAPGVSGTKSTLPKYLLLHGHAYFFQKFTKKKKKKPAVMWAMEGNGTMSNVMAIISSIITTIKLKSGVRFKWSKQEGNGKNANTFLWLGSQYSVTVQVLFLALALTLGDCTDFTQLSRLCKHSQVSI